MTIWMREGADKTKIENAGRRKQDNTLNTSFSQKQQQLREDADTAQRVFRLFVVSRFFVSDVSASGEGVGTC